MSIETRPVEVTGRWQSVCEAIQSKLSNHQELLRTLCLIRSGAALCTGLSLQLRGPSAWFRGGQGGVTTTTGRL